MNRLRWWPAAGVVVLALLWLARVWLTGDAIRQQRVVNTLVTAILAGFLLLAWLVTISGLRPRVRGAILAASLLATATAMALFRVRGVTGDLVPIVEPRWAAAPRASPPARPAELLVDAAMPPSPTDVSGAAPAATDIGVTTGTDTARLEHAPEQPSPPLPAPDGGTHDYPQFLGPTRNGVVPGVRLATDWSAQPPRRAWRQAIGTGWSGFAVAGDLAITQEQRGEDELVIAYEAATGRGRWSHSDRARYATVIAGEGPRATPTVHDGRVFTMGATGLVNALDLATGRRLWSRDVLADNEAQSPEWGKSCSPLVVGGLVVVSAGGAQGRSLVAYDAATGERAWSGGGDGSSYSSPLLTRLAGSEQIVIFNRGSLAGHDPASGAVLWEHPWPASQPNVAQPLPLPGDRLLVSSGYGIGSKVLQLSRDADDSLRASLVWESPRLKAKFTNLVFHDGSVYGLDDGVLVCLDPATGARRWKAGRYGHGQVVLAGGVLVVQTEEGEVVLVDPDPSGLKETARFQALDGKTWNPPALAGYRLLVRNDREAAAYDLPKGE